MPARGNQPGLMFNLGAFFGEIAKAVRTDVTASRAIVRHDVREQPVETPLGPGTARTEITDELTVNHATEHAPPSLAARRTTIEEVRISSPQQKPVGEKGRWH